MTLIPAIVYSFGAQPVKLLSCLKKGKCILYDGVSNEWICYPIRFIFKFDEELYFKLCYAYNIHDEFELQELWKKANRLY